jgi:hypothetical protein
MIILYNIEMAKIIRNFKSGSDWTINELKAYNIEIRNNTDERDFFSQNIDVDNVSLSELPRSVVECENLEYLDVNDRGYDFISYLGMATHPRETEESAVDDLAAELLRLLGYRGQGRVIRIHKDIDLFMCGNYTKAETDVCVLDKNKIFLLLQEDKSHINRDDPEPQLIAEAIAAFQYNNSKRVKDLGMNELEEYVFPGITMIGTKPMFYKIRITKALNEAVQIGEYPQETTYVQRFNPLLGLRSEQGMININYRVRILKCFKLFKQLMIDLAE